MGEIINLIGIELAASDNEFHRYLLNILAGIAGIWMIAWGMYCVTNQKHLKLKYTILVTISFMLIGASISSIAIYSKYENNCGRACK